MGMGKRAGKAVMSGVLSLAMMLGMLPGMSMSVFADVTQYNLSVGGVQVTSENCDDLSTNKWSYDAGSNKLTLDGFKYDYDDQGSAIVYSGDALLTIEVSNDNLIRTDDDGIVSENAELFLTGSGKITIDAADNGINVLSDPVKHYTFYMDECTAEIHASNCGITADRILITSGSLTIDADGEEGVGINATYTTTPDDPIVLGSNNSGTFPTTVDIKGQDGAFSNTVSFSFDGDFSIEGMGWDNYDSTGAGELITVSGTGPTSISLNYDIVRFPWPYRYIEEVSLEPVIPSIGGSVEDGDDLVVSVPDGSFYTVTSSKYVATHDSQGTYIFPKNPVAPNTDYSYSVTLTAVENNGIQYLFDTDLTVKVGSEEYDSRNYTVSDDGKTLTFNGILNTGKGTQEIDVNDSLDLVIGGTESLGAVLTKGDGNLSYSSSDTGVATVDSTGKVSARGIGTATITITASETSSYNEATATVAVTVSDKKTQTITASDLALAVGESKSIGAETTGDGELTYDSDNESIASVDINGKVTAQSAGTVTITITAAETSEYKEATKEITVTVGKPDQTITASDLTLKYGDSKAIGATTSGDGELTYASSNTSVATVDSTGKVTAVGGGTATITITAAETTSYKKATKTVTVTVTKLDQTITAKDIELAFGGSASIGAKTSGDGKLTYAVKSGSAVTVDSTGKVVAKAAGTATIEITAAETSGYNKATKTITVKVGQATPTPTKKPATPTPTKKPAAPTPTKKPAAPTPTKKPAAPTPTKKPATPTPTKKPATPTPTKKPATPTPTKKPATPTPTKKPAKPTPTEKPDGRISVAKAKVEFEFREYTYYGTEIKPRIAVIVNGKQLKGKTDFTGELKNNNKVGTATITIKGIGKYKDEVTKEFKIVAPTVVCGKKLDLSEAGVTGSSWKTSNKMIATVDNGVVTGKQAGPATISFKDGGKTKKFTVQVLYKDVQSTNDFWYEPTNVLTNMGVVKGYDKQTNFKPGNECSRAQMVTFLWRLAGEPAPKATKTNFKDIKKSDYFYKPVLWAVEQGITTGISKTKFGPQGICTRAQTVTFLWRMAGKPAPTSKTSKFKDVKKGAYYYEATIWASENKIVAGYSDGTFKPSGKCLRRQMVTFLYKYDNNVNGKD